MFKGTNILKFTSEFNTDEKCQIYLTELKWRRGFQCPKCKNNTWSKTRFDHIRRCNKCKHKESATAGTLFHKCKFSLHKAFTIVFLVSTGKKGISSTELSRKLGLRQKTCYYFKRKVMVAMGAGNGSKLNGSIEVDEFFVGGKEESKVGRSKGKKRQVVMGIEVRGKGIGVCRAMHVSNCGTKELKPFFEKCIEKEAEVKTDQWRGYRPLMKEYLNLTQEKSEPKKNFRLFHRQVMMLKGWLRGIHHTVKNLQPYLDEFCFRFNRGKAIERIFHNLTARMVMHQPVFISKLKLE